MSENLSKKKDEKLFEMKKYPTMSGVAKFRFTKENGVWYWDLLHKQTDVEKNQGVIASLPLPGIDLDECDTLKKCFDVIAKYRGEAWVGQIFTNIMHSTG